MRKTFTLLALVCTIILFGKSSNDFLEMGIVKHKQNNFKAAIADYNKAIEEDNSNKDAYYNRGTCELALNDYKSAVIDFNKTIKLDPKFASAYYNRATALISMKEYTRALPDLDKAIELDPNLTNAYTLRGQFRIKSGDKKGACDDFSIAMQRGDKKAHKYMALNCDMGESFKLNWPEGENWKTGSNQETEEMKMVELIHSDETLENWTEFGTMMTIKGAVDIPMNQAMQLMYKQAQKESNGAKLTFIEKDESVEYPWIIFKIEAPSFKNDKTPESQLWYIVQGQAALYTNFRAVKQATVPEDLKEKWIEFFKTSQVVSK